MIPYVSVPLMRSLAVALLPALAFAQNVRGFSESSAGRGSELIIDSTPVNLSTSQALAYWDLTYVTLQVIFAVFSCSSFILLTTIGRSKDLMSFFYIGVSVFAAYAMSLAFVVNSNIPSTYGAIAVGVVTIGWGVNSMFENLGAVVKAARVFGATCLAVAVMKVVGTFVPIQSLFAAIPTVGWHVFMLGCFLSAVVSVVLIPKVFYGADASQRETLAILSVTGLALGAVTQLSMLLYATGIVDDSPMDIVSFFSPSATINFKQPTHLYYITGWLALTLFGVFVDHKRAQRAAEAAKMEFGSEGSALHSDEQEDDEHRKLVNHYVNDDYNAQRHINDDVLGAAY